MVLPEVHHPSIDFDAPLNNVARDIVRDLDSEISLNVVSSLVTTPHTKTEFTTIEKSVGGVGANH